MNTRKERQAREMVIDAVLSGLRRMERIRVSDFRAVLELYTGSSIPGEADYNWAILACKYHDRIERALRSRVRRGELIEMRREAGSQMRYSWKFKF
jgi:hypothetical protein